MTRIPKSTAGLFALLGILALPACAPDPASHSPRVVDPWIRLAPPGAGMMAGYLVLENPGEQPLELVAVSSPVFSSAEVHRTEIVDGVARMIAEPALAVPAGGRAVFEPGGRHLMLHGPARDLGEGDEVTLALEFSDGARIEVQVPVRRGPEGGAAGTDPHHEH